MLRGFYGQVDSLVEVHWQEMEYTSFPRFKTVVYLTAMVKLFIKTRRKKPRFPPNFCRKVDTAMKNRNHY